MLGLLLVLIGVAVVGLRPWAPSSLVPSVAIAPDLRAGLAESVPLPPEQAASLADASVVRGGAPKLAAADPVGRSTGQAAPHERTTVAVAVVSPAQPVTADGDNSAPTQPPTPTPMPAPAPAAAPTPEPPPTPPATPLAAGVPESGPRGPVTAGTGGGAPGRGCAGGDEYVLVISPVEGEDAEETPLLEIRIEFYGSDGSRSELSLQGDQGDVDELVALFGAQGECVRVEEESAAEGPTEPPTEGEPGPEAEVGVGESGEALEPDLP